MNKRIISISLGITVSLFLIYTACYFMNNKKIKVDNSDAEILLYDKLEYDKFDYNYEEASSFGNYEYKFTNFSGYVSIWSIICSKDTELDISIYGDLIKGNINIILVSNNLSKKDEINNSQVIKLKQGEYRLIMTGENSTGTFKTRIDTNILVTLIPYFPYIQK